MGYFGDLKTASSFGTRSTVPASRPANFYHKIGCPVPSLKDLLRERDQFIPLTPKRDKYHALLYCTVLYHCQALILGPIDESPIRK